MAQESQPNWFADILGEIKDIPAEETERTHPASFTTVECLWVQTFGEMRLLNNFFEQAEQNLRSKEQKLEQREKSSGKNVSPEDLFLNDSAKAALEEFACLSSEFAIVGLWRCVELFRTKAIGHALNDPTVLRSLPKEWRKRFGKLLAIHLAKGSHKDLKSSFALIHDDFVDVLSEWGIEEQKIHCAEPVEELRLLNNAIKHQRQVTDSLAEISWWEDKEGEELGNLERHYRRLQPLAERYLEDLANRLRTKFPPPYGVKNAKKDQHG